MSLAMLLKICTIANMFIHVIHLVLQKLSVGPGFYDCTVQQSLFGALDSVPGCII